MKKYLALILILTVAVIFAACGDDPAANSTVNGTNASTASGNGSTTTVVTSNPNDTPTQAYKRLFDAVKSKNPDAIKAEFSKSSIGAAQTQAARSKVPVEEVYKNGFTATTFNDKLPEMRDERIIGNMGAVEVWNSRDQTWEDLPFILEESGWKLAVGDALAGGWKRPGAGMATREQMAANAAGPNTTVVNKMANFNTATMNTRPMNSNTNRR